MKLFLKGLMRGTVPFVFMVLVSLWKNFQGSSSKARAFLFNGLIILFLGMSSVIYQMNDWSFFKQIIVHYTVMLLTVFPTLLLSGFYPLSSFEDALKIFLLFNKYGIVLFITTHIIFRLHRKVVNQQ